MKVQSYEYNYRPRIGDTVSIDASGSWCEVIQIIDGGQAMILKSIGSDSGILRDSSGQALKVYSCEVLQTLETEKERKGACPY